MSIVVAAPTIAAPQSGLLAKVRKGSTSPIAETSVAGERWTIRQARVQRQVGQEYDRRACQGGSERQEAEPTQTPYFTPHRSPCD